MKPWWLASVGLLYIGCGFLALTCLVLERQHFEAVQTESTALLAVASQTAREQQLLQEHRQALVTLSHKIVTTSSALVANHYNPCVLVLNKPYLYCDFLAINFNSFITWLLTLHHDANLRVRSATIRQINDYGMVAVQLTLS